METVAAVAAVAAVAFNIARILARACEACEDRHIAEAANRYGADIRARVAARPPAEF